MQLAPKHISLFLIFFLLSLIASAQENYRVVNWNVDQGMSNGFISCMIKDVYGFMWFGTRAGLDRFDGNSFKIFLPIENDPKSLLNKNIQGLIEDSLHNIWVGTDEGLSRYDIKADTFTNFLPMVDTPGSNNMMIPFWVTKDDLYCLESLAKIAVYDLHSLKRKKTVQLSHKLKEPPNPRIQDMIYDEESNAIWRLPEDNEQSGGGIFRLNLSNGKEDHFDWPCFRNIKNDFHWSEGMCYDKLRNSIWINDVEGLMQFTLNDKHFHYIESVKNIHSPAPGIHMDSKDRVWVSTRNDKGIFIFDPATQTTSIPIPYDSALQKEIDQRSEKIYCDRDGIAWVAYWPATGHGINQLIPYSAAATRHSHENSYNITDRLTAWDVPINTKNLRGIDQKKNFHFFTADHPGRKAWLIDEDSNDLEQLDIQTRQCRPILIKNTQGQIISRVALKGIYFGYFMTRFKGSLIFWGVKPDKREGIFMFDQDSAIAREILEFPDVEITAIIADDDHIFIKTKNKLITNLTYTYLNGSFVRTKIPLDSLAWTAIASDPKDGSWWIGADRKIVHYNKKFKPIQTYSAEELVPQGNDMYNFFIDDRGKIWFNSNRSLVRLNPETGQLISLSEKDGFQPQMYNVFVAYLLKAGAVDFILRGGSKGADYIMPDKLKEAYPPSYVYLKSLNINQNAFPLSTDINNLQEISLNYTQNKINIETGIIDFYTKGNSHLRYKLDGRDSTWQYGTYYNTIRYEGLPPANYKLVMQASNAANEFNGPEKILVIRISPAFWNTWWFRISAIFLLCLLVYWLVRYRSRQLKKENIQLEEKVTLRTKELNHSLEELKDTQTQLIQREKMASLGELTAGIAHEIQNPLNFVNNFSEVNEELIEEMDQAIEQGNLAGVRSLADNIKNNIEKVIHHGKRADGIVKGMLQHSRTGTGQKVPTDINALADEYLRLSFHGFRAKEKNFNAAIKTSFEENIGNVNIVPQDIGRVFQNLLNNAFYSVKEKMKQGPETSAEGISAKSSYAPAVSITTKKLGDKVEIRVWDNGIGISKEVIDKIYQPFFTTKPTGEGTGLGLSLSYDIITKMHGGELKVETKEGEYAEFIVQLPIQ